MGSDDRQQVLSRWFTGCAAPYIVAPGSGATITLYDSGSSEPAGARGARMKRVIAAIYASHASAASGLSFEVSYDNGTNWDVWVQYSISATTLTVNYVSMAAPRWRIRYTNSASVLTAWRGANIGDEYERASQ